MKLLRWIFIALCSAKPLPWIAPFDGQSIIGLSEKSIVKKSYFPSNHLIYHLGNPVLTDPVEIYCIYALLTLDIFYGDWSGHKLAIEVLENLAMHIGNSSWYGIMKHYYYQESQASDRIYVSGKVNFVTSVYDNYSKGKDLKDGDVLGIIQRQVDLGLLPERYSALYFVLTASDVTETFDQEYLGKDYCGYHYTGTLTSKQKIFYSLVGNPERFRPCRDYANGRTPNGAVIDSMASTIAHELVEAVSDPDDDDHRSWEDSEFSENGDKCAVRSLGQ